MMEHVNPRGLMKTSVPGVKGTAHRWWQLDEGRICWWWTWIGSLGRGCGEGGGAAWHGIPVWVEDELSLQPSRTEGLTSNPMEDNIHKLDWAPCCLTAGEKRHLGGQVARAAILEARSLTDSGYIHTITPSSAPRIYMLTLLYFSIKALSQSPEHASLQGSHIPGYFRYAQLWAVYTRCTFSCSPRRAHGPWTAAAGLLCCCTTCQIAALAIKKKKKQKNLYRLQCVRVMCVRC